MQFDDDVRQVTRNYLLTHFPGDKNPAAVVRALEATHPDNLARLAVVLRMLGDRPPTPGNVAAVLSLLDEPTAVQFLLHEAQRHGNRYLPRRGHELSVAEALAQVQRPSKSNSNHLVVNDPESLGAHLEAYQVWRDLWLAAAKLGPGDLGPDSLWVDVGCGYGTLLCQMAERVLSGWDRRADPQGATVGRIVGFDLNPDAVAAAEKLIAERGLEAIVRVKLGEANTFPGIDKGSVDRIVITNTVQYLPDPVASFGTYGDYLKPGGTLASKEMWWGGFKLSRYGAPVSHWDELLAAYQQFEQVVLHEDTWAGRLQAKWMKEAGLEVKLHQPLCITLRRETLTPAAMRYYHYMFNDVLLNPANPVLRAELRNHFAWLFSEENPQHFLNLPGVQIDDVEYLTVAQKPDR